MIDTKSREIAPRWIERGGDAARCSLCFRHCSIADGSFGACGQRGVSDEGEIIAPNLGRFAAAAIDPIEKKPLRRWRPGSMIFSLGSVGCNMLCPFCQNFEISDPASDVPTRAISIDELVDKADRSRTGAVAFTYNEPTLQAEYIVEASRALADRGIATVMVTNGLFDEAADELASSVSAMNVDVKTFSAERYRAIGGDLDIVRRNVELLVERSVHVELTSLIVPSLIDTVEEVEAIAAWASSISHDIPLHITRYHPARNFSAPPTDVDLMKKMERAAKSQLAHVYLGNV